MVLVMCVLTAVVWLVIIIFLVWLCAGGTGVSVLYLHVSVASRYLMDTSSGHGVYVRAILILILFVAIL